MSLPDPPRTVFLELTSFCNMHCSFCPSDVLRRPKGHLAEDRIRKFLDQLHALGFHPPVMLNVLGEPLLNKNVYHWLDELEAAGHPVTLITNMTLLEDPGVRSELLRHGNLTLAMSLQTATSRAYRWRGYDRLPFKAFARIFRAVVEDKFRSNSRARLELHVASNYVLTRDATIQADGALNLWANFPDEKTENRWIARTLRRLDRLAARTKRRYPAAFEASRAEAAEKYRDHIGTRIAVDRAGLPPGFHRLKDDAFWGYMALPDVFLVFKSFELWTRDRAFLEAALPPGRFAYVEERVDPRPCVMADSFGMLADGRFVLCCLDYEGEMDLGGIDGTSVLDALLSEKRAAVRTDAMAAGLCRRCRGNLFIFDTALLPAGTVQTVDKFGRGFWAREDDLYGKGGRWTDGRGWAYVFARVPARRIRLTFRSDFEGEAPLGLAVREYDSAAGDFLEPSASWTMKGRKGEPVDFEAAFDFHPGRFYRMEITSPSFVPDEQQRNGDTRRLGLAVFSLSILP